MHTCKGLVELAISLLSIDHGCHVGILLCAYMHEGLVELADILTEH